jgi:C-terminal processing protease CtpA/Prc
MDKDWNTILKAYIPKFINAKDELAYEMAVIELSGDIQDTHANLWRGRDQFTKYLGTKRAAAQVTFVEGNLVVVAYFNEALAAASGLQKGDVITEIDGKSVVALINDTKKFYPASNRPTVLRDFAKSALKANTETLQLTIRRNQIEKTISTQLYTSKELDMKAWYAQKLAKKSYKILEGNIGYINLEVLKKQEIPAMKTALKNTQGIVVDIRNYPREFVVHALASFFTTTTKPFVKFTMCNSQNIGAFLWSNSFDVKASADAYPRKLVVLVNEITQSQAEFTAMALRATDNATIIGSQTAGADGNITELKLPGGLEIYFTAIGIYYPDGTDTQRIGIVPDIEVQPTIQGIRDGKDELLAKAIEIIQEAKK